MKLKDDPLDCKLSGSHNTSGRSPSTAPMKTNSPQSWILENRWRQGVQLFAFLSLICLAVVSGVAQLKNQKRVTALQLGEAAAGARVTIVSDSALNDYEAFRRGDRFYVKIPLAEFAAAQPTFRGNGFEDVRVQKVGDSVVVSFKLQPGATARVDQRSNRLDVIFSTVAAGRSAPTTTANSYPTSRNRRNSADPDASAGPVPPMSGTTSAQPGRNSYPNPLVEGPNSSFGATTRGSRSTRRSANEGSAGQNNKGNVPAPKLPSQTQPAFPPPAASPAVTPWSAPAAFATPSVTAAQQPAGVPVSGNSSTPQVGGWDSRVKFLKAWAQLNRSTLMVGGLLALALLMGLVLWSRTRGRPGVANQASRKAPTMPESEKVVGRPVKESEPLTRTPVATTPVTAAVVGGAAVNRHEAWASQPAPTGFARAELHQPRDADQEREVFEL